jgi:hypothetical protein
MRSVTVMSSTAQVVPYVTDRDTKLFAAYGAVGQSVVSTDPELDVTAFFAGTLDGVELNILASSVWNYSQLNFPVPQGTTLFVHFAAAGFLQLLFDDPVS